MLKKCLAASVISMIVLPATAQSSFNELLVFGDSLFDSGNLGGLRLTNRLGDGNGDYSVGDYAPIAPQLFAQNLNITLDSAMAGGTNYAVAGYQTANILDSIAGAGLALPAGGAVAKPAYLADNPSINANALVLLDGGGNDLREIVTSNLPDDIPNLLTASAQNLVGAIGTLDAAGARYIMVANVPNLGSSAGVQYAELGSAGAVAGFSAATAGFNRAVEVFTNTTSANVVPVDLSGLLSFILDESRAESFGFTTGMIDITGGGLMFDSRYMCFDGSSGTCLEHPVYGINGASPDPSRLFFNDALHPTAAVGQISSDYLTDIIMAPQTIGLLPELALSASRAQVGVASNELRQSRWSALKHGLFVAGDSTSMEYDIASSPETQTAGLTVGYTHAVTESVLMGVAVTVGSQDVDINSAEFETDSYGITGLLGYRQEKLFVDASLALSVLSYDDIERDVKLANQTFTAKGDTDGHAWALDVLAGYDLLDSPNYHLAPAVGARWINTTTDSYAESGGQISNYAWDEQSRDSMQWRYGIVASAKVTPSVELFAEVFGTEEQKDNNQTIGVRNTNLGFSSYQLPSFQANSDSFVSSTIGASVTTGRSRFNLSWNYSDQADGTGQVLLSYKFAM